MSILTNTENHPVFSSSSKELEKWIDRMIEFDNDKTLYRKDQLYIFANKMQKEMYPDLDTKFKSILNVSLKSKHHSLFVHSVNGFSLSAEIANRDRFTFRKKEQVNKYFTKYEFKEQAVRRLFKTVYLFLKARYDVLYLPQIMVSFIMAALEFFDLFDINWSIVKAKIDEIIFSWNEREDDDYYRMLSNKVSYPYAQKEAKKRPTGLKYKSKSDRIDVDNIRAYYEIKKDAVLTKEIFAGKYNVSTRTIHRLMKKAGII